MCNRKYVAVAMKFLPTRIIKPGPPVINNGARHGNVKRVDVLFNPLGRSGGGGGGGGGGRALCISRAAPPPRQLAAPVMQISRA